MTPCFSCDWYSFSAKLLRPLSFSSLSTILDVRVEEMPSTRIYSNHAICWVGDVKVFTILWHPLTPVISNNSCSITLSNRYCYGSYDEFRQYLCVKLKLSDCRLSRIDVARDFVATDSIYGGNVQEFLRDFVSNRIALLRYSRFSLYGESVQAFNSLHGFTWGSRSSPVYCRLYNKSLEMCVMHESKPYIHEKWLLHGWDGKTPVWRLEFECKRPRAKQGARLLSNIESWEPSNIALRWFGLYQRYATMIVCDNKRKTRCTPFNLFDILPLIPPYSPISPDKQFGDERLPDHLKRIYAALDTFAQSRIKGDQRTLDAIGDKVWQLYCILRSKYGLSS